MDDIRRKCIPMVNLLKFTSNKNILSGVVASGYNQVCSQTLPLNKSYDSLKKSYN